MPEPISVTSNIEVKQEMKKLPAVSADRSPMLSCLSEQSRTEIDLLSNKASPILPETKHNLLYKSLDDLSQIYAKKYQSILSDKTECEINLQKLKQSSDEKFCAQSIAEEKNALQNLRTKIIANEAELINIQEKITLLQQQASKLKQLDTDQKFVGTLDEQCTWFMTQEALRQIHIACHAEADLQKTPIQQATFAGRIKVAKDFIKRTETVIAEMQAEFDKLTHENNQLCKEKNTFQEELQNHKNQRKTCQDVEKQKQAEQLASVVAVADQKKFIADKCSEYDTTTLNLRTTISNAAHALTELESKLTTQAAVLKAIDVEIQDLDRQPRTAERSRRVDRGCMKRKPTGIFGWGAGEDVWESKWVDEKYLEDTGVDGKIAQKRLDRQGPQNNFNALSSAIAAKRDEINQAQNRLAQEEAAFPKNKEALIDQLHKLEAAARQTPIELDKARTLRQQKELIIASVEESVSAKEKEIKGKQDELATKNKCLADFNTTLLKFKESLAQLQQQESLDQERAAKLQEPVKVQTIVDAKKAAELRQQTIEISKALESELSKQVDVTKILSDLKKEENTRENRLQSLSNPTDRKTVEDREIHALQFQIQIDKANKLLGHTAEELAEVHHELLLGQGLLVSGYQPCSNTLDNLIICLLQGVFQSYPIYRPSSLINTPMPAPWRKHLEKIKSKLSGDQKLEVHAKELTSELVSKLVDIINDEYRQDRHFLKVNLSGKPVVCKASSQDSTSTLNLWITGGQVLLLIPESEQMKQGATIRAQQLLTWLLPPSQLLRALCERNILRDCKKKSLEDCAPEELVNYGREELQFDWSKLQAKNPKESLFTLWVDRLLQTHPSIAKPSCDLNENSFQAVQYCLRTLQQLYPALSVQQQEEFLKLSKQYYLDELKSCILTEIKNCSAKHNQAKQLVEESKKDLAAKMLNLENEQKNQQLKLFKLEQNIQQQVQALTYREQQAKDLEKNYQQQNADVDTEIKRLEIEKTQVEEQLKELTKNGAAGEQKINELTSLRKKLVMNLAELNSRSAVLSEQLTEVRNTALALQQQKLAVDNKQAAYAEKRLKAELCKENADKKIKFLETWRIFLKTLHECVLNDKKAFDNRKSILETIQKFAREEKDSSLANYYQFLITDQNLACLHDNPNIKLLQSCLEQTKNNEFKALTTNWKNDLYNVLQDVLGTPSISSELVSPLTIEGNNISWVQVMAELKTRLTKRVNACGLSFDENNKLVVVNYKLFGVINELPAELKALFTRYIKIIFQHETVIGAYNAVDQTPHWKELDKCFSEAELIDFISKAKIDFTEVLRAHVDSIELTAAHNLYLDADIELPSINLTLFCKAAIHCKDNLVINTSAKQLPNIVPPKAKKGDDYKADSGREGDDGLDGAAGDCAGHIIIKSETGAIEKLDQIKCVANGSNGQKGQEAGDGGKGFKGMDILQTEAEKTDGFGKAQFILAQCRTPGMDEHGNFTRTNEFSGPGGHAGKAGWGGEKGLSGSISIADQKHEIHLFDSGERSIRSTLGEEIAKHFEQKEGKDGENADRNAQGGEPGTGGIKGLDHLRNKRSFFHEAKEERGHFDPRIFTDTQDYLEPDAACGVSAYDLVAPVGSIVVNLLKGTKVQDPFCDRYQRQIRVYGYSLKAKASQQIVYGKQGDKGLANNKTERQKSASKRNRAQRSKTIQQQLAQVERLNQAATAIQQKHIVLKADNQYAKEISQYKTEAEKLAHEIEECRQVEASSAQESSTLSNSIQSNQQKISELSNELQKVERLKHQANQQIIANDTAQLENFTQATELNNKVLQAQAELACVSIDASSEKNAKARLIQLHAALQNALQVQQNAISQEITAAKNEHLLQSQQLAALQDEYLRLQQANKAQNNQNNTNADLEKLAAEFAQTEQKQETEQFKQQFQSLLNGKAFIAVDVNNPLLPKISDEKNVLFKAPTLQEQHDKVFLTFKILFGEDEIWHELVKKLKDPKKINIWPALFHSIRFELVKLGDREWMQKAQRFDHWLSLLKYSENVLQTTYCSPEELDEIHVQLQLLITEFSKKGQQSQSLAALQSLTNIVEQRYLEMLVELGLKDSCECKEANQDRQLLLEHGKRILLLRASTTPELRQDNKLKYKLNFLRCLHELIKIKQEEKASPPLAKLLIPVLANTTQVYPGTAGEEKDTFLSEIKSIAEKLSISLQEKGQLKNLYCFERLQQELDYRFTKMMTSVNKQESKDVIKETALDRQKQSESFKKLIETNKTFFFSLLNDKNLQTAKSPLAVSILRQIAKNHQLIAITQKQILLQDEKHYGDPITRGQILHELYTQTPSHIKVTSKELKDEVDKLAKDTVIQFVQTAGLKTEDWLAILVEPKNIELLKKDQAFLCLLIFEKQIIPSRNPELIMRAYKHCLGVLKSEPELAVFITRELEPHCLSALEVQIELIKKQLHVQLEKNTNLAHIQIEIVDVLNRLADLWFDPTCLIPIDQRFKSMDLFKNIAVSEVTLKQYRTLLDEQLTEQKNLFLKGSAGNTGKVELAARLQEIYKQVNLHVNPSKGLIGSNTQVLNDLQVCISTLRLIFNNNAELLTLQEVEVVEKFQYELSQVLIKQRPADNKNIQQNNFWLTVQEYSQELGNMVAERYRVEVENRFNLAAVERSKKILELKNTVSAMHKHFAACQEFIHQIKLNRLTPEEKSLQPVMEIKIVEVSTIQTRNKNQLEQMQSDFIELILKRLQDICFLQDPANKDTMSEALQYFSQIKQAICRVEHKDEKSTAKIEQYLVTQLNISGLQSIKAQKLFGTTGWPGSLNTGFSKLQELLQSNASFTEFFKSWSEVIKNVVSYSLDEKNVHGTEIYKQAWLKNLIDDSHKLWMVCLPETTEQEAILESLEANLKFWHHRMAEQMPAELNDSSRKLAEIINYTSYRRNHYFYVDRLLELQTENDVLQKAEQLWDQTQQSTEQVIVGLFANINHDLGAAYTKRKLIAEMGELKPAYTPLECQRAQLAITNNLQRIQNKISVLDTQVELTPDAKETKQIDSAAKRLAKLELKHFGNVNQLRKILINLTQLNEADIEAINKFTSLFIAFQTTRETRSAEQNHYLNLIAQRLAELYKQRYLHVFQHDPKCIEFINHVWQVNYTNQRSDISLAVYYHLCDIPTDKPSNTESKILDITAISKIDGVKILNKLFKQSVSSGANTIFEQFKLTLLTKEAVWKLPYFVACLPLLAENIFSKENYEQTFSALVKLHGVNDITARTETKQENARAIFQNNVVKNFTEGRLSIDAAQRVSLFQIMLVSYVKNYIMPAIQNNPATKEMLLRILTYIDKLVDKYIASTNATKQQVILKEINQCYCSIKTIAKVECTIEPYRLFTASENIFYKQIPDAAKASLMLAVAKQPPDKWEFILKDQYFSSIKKVLVESKNHSESKITEFSGLFTIAYNTAKLNHASAAKIENWLNCVAYLLQGLQQGQLKLEQVNLLLQSIIARGSVEHVLTNFDPEQPALILIKECLFAECSASIEENCEEDQQRLITHLDDLKLAIFNANECGTIFLRQLSKGLADYRTAKKTSLYTAYIQEMLVLIKETKAYQSEQLLKKFAEQDILCWNRLLKREKYAQAFGLQDSNSNWQIDLLTTRLSLLEKSYPLQLLSHLINFLRLNCVDLVEVNKYLQIFVNHELELDEQLLDKLDKKSSDERGAYLKLLIDERFACQKRADREPDDVVKEMRKEIAGINKYVQHMLVADDSGKSTIEQILLAAKLQADKNLDPVQNKAIKDWNEQDITQWLSSFRPNAKQFFSQKTKLVEFIAVLKRAFLLKTGKKPRATQLTALLLFIDAAQNGRKYSPGSNPNGGGRLANISTGEGKSFVTAMTAIYLALQNERVDIVTSNEILAERDSKAQESLFELFGIKVGNNCDKQCEKNENLRKERYTNCQVIYGTTASFQRDVLLTTFFNKGIRGHAGQVTQGHWLLLDEVDSMFIDNAEKILYISHSIKDLRYLNDLFLMIWAAVKSPERESENTINLDAITASIKKYIAEGTVVLPNVLKEFIDRRLQVWIKNAYLAKRMSDGKEYIIPKLGENANKIVIMDLDTGVEQVSTQWSNGLHQFIQLKHSKNLSEESLKAVFMANATFFKSYNGHIFGMTGTLGSDIELDLMSRLFGIDYFRLPRNMPERYRQEESVIVGPTKNQDATIRTARENWKQAIVQEVRSKQGILKDAPASKIAADEDNKESKAEIGLKDKLQEASVSLASLQDEINKLVENIEQKKVLLSRALVLDANNVERDKLRDEKTQLENNLVTQQTNLSLKKQEIKNIENELTALADIRRARRVANTKPGARAVLIICANVQDAKDLEAELLKDKELRKSTIKTLLSKDDPPITDKLAGDEIIIATNIAGRGTDFETLDILEKNGGLHVVMSYIPSNVRVETQAFRRTARNGCQGSGKFIVACDRLAESPYITTEHLRDIRDIEEAARLDKIRTFGIPKLEREQKLFEKFIALQKSIRDKLLGEQQDPKEFDEKALEVQLKSLQNKWAFFLDEMESKIADIHGVSEDMIQHDYEEFTAKMWGLVASKPFRLITEPAEMMKMARYCMDTEIKKNFSDSVGYQLALEYLEAIIAREPKLAGFAHYYKAYCNFGLKRNSLADKQDARRSLKKAIELMEEKVARLSTAVQFVAVLRGRNQELGQGLEVDEFTRSFTNEISLIQVHINSARQALGTDLTPESFKSGTVTDAEHNTVFANVRKHLKNAVIKDHRLSKKVRIQVSDDKQAQSEIMYAGKVVEIPSVFAQYRDSIIAILKPKTAAADLQTREISPASFIELFVTKQQFMAAMGNRIKEQSVFELHADAGVNLQGQWDDTNLFNNGEEKTIPVLKELIGKLKAGTREDQLIAEIITQTKMNKDQAQSVIQYLRNKYVLKEHKRSLLGETECSIIKNYLENIELGDQTINLEVLNLSAYPELSGKIEILKNLLKPGVILNVEKLQQEHKIDKRAFNLLFHLLKAKGYFKTNLLQRFQLQTIFTNTVHHVEVERELLHLYEFSSRNETSESTLCSDPLERCNKLWSYLKSMKVVKDPAVRFNLADNFEKPKDLIDKIKNAVEDNIGHLIADKSKEEQEKYVKSIYATLEKSIGKIKQFKDLKIDKKTLLECLQGGNVPPEFLELTEQCYDIVLSLAEDKGWDWNVFACALIGVLQIAAGVFIGALSFGAAAFISAILINEGIGDLVYAVQCGISGNFSWSAYGERKWQSLLISIATVGIGMGLGAVATSGAGLGANAVGVLTQKFLVKLAEAGLACAASLAADQLIKHALSLLVSELSSNFEKWVKESAAYQLAEKRLQNLIGKFYDKFGVKQADLIIKEVIESNAQLRNETFLNNLLGAATNSLLQNFSGNLKAASEQMKNSGDSAAKILAVVAELAGYVSTAVDVINKIKDIASLTSESLSSLEKSLEKAYDTKLNTKTPSEIAEINKAQPKAKFCEDILNTQTTTIVAQIKEFVTRAVMQPGAQALMQLAVKPVNEYLNKTMEKNLNDLKASIAKSGHQEEEVTQLLATPVEEQEQKYEDRTPAPQAAIEAYAATSFAEGTQREDNVSSFQTEMNEKSENVMGTLFAQPEQSPWRLISENLDATEKALGPDKSNASLLGTLGIFSAGTWSSVDPSFSNKVKGLEGEAAGRAAMRRIGQKSLLGNQYEQFPSTFKDGTGFDQVWVKREGGKINDIVIVESKYAKSGKATLKNTKTMGRQVSAEWIEGNIRKLRHAHGGDKALQKTGRLLDLNTNKIRVKVNVLDPSGTNRWSKNSVRNLPENVYTTRPSPSAPKGISKYLANGAVTKGLKFLGAAGALCGVYHDASRIAEQYKADSVTGNYRKTTQLADQVMGAWTGGAVGTALGSMIPGPGSLIGGLVGGAAGYFAGEAAMKELQNRFVNRR